MIEITDRRSVHREPGYISAFARYLGRSAGMTSMAFDLEGRAASGQGCAALAVQPLFSHGMVYAPARDYLAEVCLVGPVKPAPILLNSTLKYVYHIPVDNKRDECPQATRCGAPCL